MKLTAKIATGIALLGLAAPVFARETPPRPAAGISARAHEDHGKAYSKQLRKHTRHTWARKHARARGKEFRAHAGGFRK